MRVNHAPMLAVLICGFFSSPVLAAQEATDMKLEDAGFVMRPADTAEKLAHARRVPPRKFIARTKNGKIYYIYADPDTCKCVFLGDQVALQAYRDMRRRLGQPDLVPASGAGPEAEIIQDMDSDTSDLISDGNILDLQF